MSTKTPIEQILDKLEYTPTNAEPSKDGIPHVTHESILKLGELSVRVYVLSDGNRIIPEEDMKRIFGV